MIVPHINTTGDTHPKSVLKYHQSNEHLHPTQKPLDLCEWLIRTYSNEGDFVIDFCMGSVQLKKVCDTCSDGHNNQLMHVPRNWKLIEAARKLSYSIRAISKRQRRFSNPTETLPRRVPH